MSMAVRRLVPNLPTTPTHPLVTLALSMTSGVTAAAPSLAFLPKTSLLHRSFRLLFSFPFSGALLSRPLYFGLRRTVAAMRPQAPHTWHVMEPPTLTIPISPPQRRLLPRPAIGPAPLGGAEVHLDRPLDRCFVCGQPDMFVSTRSTPGPPAVVINTMSLTSMGIISTKAAI